LNSFDKLPKVPGRVSEVEQYDRKPRLVAEQISGTAFINALEQGLQVSGTRADKAIVLKPR
jgi:hypothetical protein